MFSRVSPFTPGKHSPSAPVSGRMPRRLSQQFQARRLQTRGATVIEYALIAGLIAVVVVASVGLVGTSTRDSLGNTASEVSAAIKS